MSADLQFWHPTYLADAKGCLLYRYVNTLNTPISSASWLADGRAIADVYELVFTLSGGNVTCTVDPLINGTKNPYRNMTGASVIADGSTPNVGVVPGVSLVVSASANTGWKARVAVGCYLADDGSYTDFFAYGVVETGQETVGQRVALKNVGDASATSCAAYALPGFYYTGTNHATFIKSIAPHSNTARHDMATTDSYAITFSDWKDGGGGHKTADVYVNAVLTISDAIFDGETIYEYGSGNGYNDTNDGLEGLQIILADTLSDPSAVTVTLKVRSDMQAWVQFASDTSGTPGTYSHQDLTLTEAGEPTGTITADGAAYFWHKLVLPDGTAPGDIRTSVILARGLTV